MMKIYSPVTTAISSPVYGSICGVTPFFNNTEPEPTPWILATGKWNDNGVWDDNATWNDGV
jgi:hypothetical protein